MLIAIRRKKQDRGKPKLRILLRDKQTNKQKPTLLEAYRILNRAECRVLDKLVEANGKTNREISEELFLTPKSLENYITRIGAALGLQGRGTLKTWASKQNKK